MREKCFVHRKIFTRSPQARRATTRRQHCRTTLNELSSGRRHHQYTPTCTYRNPATYTIATARLNGFPPAAQFKVWLVRLGCSPNSLFVKSFPRRWQSPVLAVSFASIKCNRRSMLLSLRERRSLHLCVCLRPRSFGHRSGLPPCKRVVWTAAPAQCVPPTATPRRSTTAPATSPFQRNSPCTASTPVAARSSVATCPAAPTRLQLSSPLSILCFPLRQPSRRPSTYLPRRPQQKPSLHCTALSPFLPLPELLSSN